MRVLVYSDGGARGNPGPAAIGAVVYEDTGNGPGRRLAEVSEFIGESTNNVAEYRALIAGLSAADALGADSVGIRADSELVVRQVKGEYRVKHSNIRPLYEEVASRLENLRDWDIEHVPRDQNEAADALVNRELESRGYPKSSSPSGANASADDTTLSGEIGADEGGVGSS